MPAMFGVFDEGVYVHFHMLKNEPLSARLLTLGLAS
jgi:hypothetical protein